MVCDICNKQGRFNIIKPSVVRDAVINGFNPYKEGLASDPSELLGMDSMNTYNTWKQMAIDGAASHTDWNICDQCVVVVQKHLQSSETSGSSSSKAYRQKKAWWKFWGR